MNLSQFLEIDQGTEKLIWIIFGILIFFTVLFHSWRLIRSFALLDEMILRTHSWWAIFLLYLLFFCINRSLGHLGLALLGVFALREFFEKFELHRIPERVRWLAYIFVGLQFYLASKNWLVPTIIGVPVIFAITVQIWILLVEDPQCHTEAVSLSIWGILLTTYGLSHLSLFLAMPPIPGYSGTTSSYLLYYIFLTQFNDVMQFIWGTLLGKHPIAPKISPKKTWEGFLGGLLSITVLAYLLRDITPFSASQSMVIGLVLSIAGFFGDLNISALKRNLSLKDMGNLIPGHGGLLDRIDSITLSSILYFYIIFYWFY